MRKLLAGLCAIGIACSAVAARPADPAFYELRTYHANPGKLEALKTRFRDHTLAIFARLGMTNVAYWEQAEGGGDGTLIYVLGYPSREAREAAWARFRTDPEWQRVAAASEANGKLVAKVDSVFMTLTDFSPHPKLPGGVMLK